MSLSTPPASLPASLYQKLLIVNPPERSKHVAFTDLNEVRTYHYREYPAKVSRLPVESILRDRIEYLERKLARSNHYQEESQMAQIKQFPSPLQGESPTSSTASSSPKAVSPTATIPAHNDSAWQNQGIHLAHPPRNVQKALEVETPVKVPLPPHSPRKEAVPPKPLPSVARRIVGGLGAFLGSFGTIGGFFSIVALGPLGLAVTGGCFLLGMGLMWAASRMK